jgi:NADH dehydrogenase (ubiquinone) Fe-S protein 6
MSSLSRAASRLFGRGSSSPFRSISVSAAPRADAVPTHTGMQFSEDDPRNVRFAVTGLKKQTNTKWAIDLISQVPPKKVHQKVVSCDGGGGALGHPKIFINLDPSGPQACNYRGLCFEMDHSHAHY